MAKFNFTADATEEAGQYTPVPEGEYVLSIVKVEHAFTSNKKHMLKLELQVDEGPFIGRKVWTNIVFNPKGEPGHGLTVQALKAFGFEYDGTFEIDTDDWTKSRTCRAKLVIEEYDVEKDGVTVTRRKNAIPTAGYITEKTDAPAKPAQRAPAPASSGGAKRTSGVPF